MESMIPRCFSIPEQSFFLFGPRGTGKSTLLREKTADAVWIDLLEADQFRSYSAHPEKLRDVAEGAGKNARIVIDEIQKVPELLSQVHSLIEKHKDFQFILTGSSPRKIRKKGVDLLAGRALRKTLHPFIASELGSRFDLESALVNGLLPLALDSKEPQDVLQTYVSLYLKEEVQDEGLTRRIGDFARFLEAISFSHGEELNISNVARDCEVKRKTVEGYVGILEDLLLSFRLPVFAKRARRAVTSHPKFYFFDAGVYRAIRPKGPLDNPEQIQGAAFEGLIAQHLAAWNAYSGDKHELYFWRTKAGTEVDFVLYGPEVFCGIEVKCTARIREEDLRGLRSFRKDYPEAKTVLVYMGTERLMRNNVLCIPAEFLLKNLTPGKTDWLE